MKARNNKTNKLHLAARIGAPILALGLLAAVPVQAFAAEADPAAQDEGRVVEESTTEVYNPYPSEMPEGGYSPVTTVSKVASVTAHPPYVTQAAYDAALPDTSEPAAISADEAAARNGEEARLESDQQNMNYWEPQFAAMENGTESGTIKLDCNGVDYVPAYVLTAVSDTGDTLQMTHGGETYTLRSSDIGTLDPSLNYRFADLYALGYAG